MGRMTVEILWFLLPPLPYICVLFSGRYSFIIADFLFNDKRRRAGNHIAGFFIVFGFMGYQTLNNQIQTYPSIIISILLGIAGLVIFALVGYAFDLLTKMDVVFSANTVGLYGLCLTEIKAKKGNVGKIRLTMNGKITEFDAVTYNEVTLSKGTSVKITNSLSDTCVVVEQG